MGFIEIDFYGKQIDEDHLDETIKKFDDLAAQNKDIQLVVDFTHNQLTDACIPRLKNLILNPRVRELRFDNNQLTANGIDCLCDLLERRKVPLSALSVSGNNLGQDGALRLATFLTRNGSQLAFLGLEDCQIDAQGITALARELFNNTCLRTLNLNKNAVKTGLFAIAQLIYFNKTLESLLLCECELDAEILREFLGAALKENSTLVELNIEANDLSEVTLQALIEKLVYNQTLQTYAGPDHQGQIARICERNKILPCNARWLREFNPLATLEQKMAALILDTPLSPDSSLLLTCTQSTMRQGSFVQFTQNFARLSESVVDTSYKEACHASIATKTPRGK